MSLSSPSHLISLDLERPTSFSLARVPSADYYIIHKPLPPLLTISKLVHECLLGSRSPCARSHVVEVGGLRIRQRTDNWSTQWRILRQTDNWSTHRRIRRRTDNWSTHRRIRRRTDNWSTHWRIRRRTDNNWSTHWRIRRRTDNWSTR